MTARLGRQGQEELDAQRHGSERTPGTQEGSHGAMGGGASEAEKSGGFGFKKKNRHLARKKNLGRSSSQARLAQPSRCPCKNLNARKHPLTAEGPRPQLWESICLSFCRCAGLGVRACALCIRRRVLCERNTSTLYTHIETDRKEREREREKRRSRERGETENRDRDRKGGSGAKAKRLPARGSDYFWPLGRLRLQWKSSRRLESEAQNECLRGVTISNAMIALVYTFIAILTQLPRRLSRCRWYSCD